jgi:hypothetical protein
MGRVYSIAGLVFLAWVAFVAYTFTMPAEKRVRTLILSAMIVIVVGMVAAILSSRLMTVPYIHTHTATITK